MTVHVSQFSMTVWVPEGDVPPPVEAPVAHAMQFGAGTNGNTWYFVASVSDSGDELRSKNVKPVHVTGKVTNAGFKIYSYGPTEGINVTDLEDGTNSTSGLIPLDDVTQVTQSERIGVNVPNACLHTIRVEGEWDGAGEPDSIHEIIYELAIQGVRR